ncbi:zinc finger BED domain-containing protein RICESLEEPER 1-like isoform X1 [Panicum virgatum]|uniref:zinc finger BED domain-containing protein RICESLEEPER 1-like isoform X1 n=1 Tax=Panicum virgatum TaxID=38727 RepID=UPI0019D580E7|nr:zinc finger BED domain-containing protein RICESLEEPER 1-like isoform X1 [Panicum virgatum]
MASEENTQGRQVAPTQRKGKKLAPRSGMYQHFTPNDQKTLWSCKFCGDKVGADTNKHGTTNLWKHHRKCKGRGGGMESQSHPTSSSPPPRPQPQPQPQLQPSDPGESSDRREPAGLDDQEASRDLARMIALHGHDPSVLEDDHFRSFVRRLNPQFKLPSREDIEDLCCDIFQIHKTNMHDSCRNASGRTCAVGIAKTMEAREVLYATCQFIDGEWNLHKADVYAYVVLPTVGSLDHMVKRFVTDLSEEYHGDYTLFIMAREMTGDIDYGELKDSIEKVLGSDSPPTNRELICTTYMDRVLHSIARCLLPNPDFQKEIMSYVEDLGGIFQVRRECARHGLDDPWEYNEDWYWCYCPLEIFHQDEDFESGSEELLHSLWKVIHRAIKRVSDSSRPTSNLCLEQLFMVRYALKSQLSNATAADAGKYSGFGEKNVADVLNKALETVDKAIQDSYLVWSIPHVLDPRYKLRSLEDNFKRAFGPDDANCYTSSVRRKLKELYITNSIEYDDDMEEDDDDTEDDVEVSDGRIVEMAGDSSTTPLEQSWDDSHAQAETELDRYLQDSPADRTIQDFDILNWWKVHGSVRYPTVARMARDALAMPICSKLTSDQIAHVRSRIRGY